MDPLIEYAPVWAQNIREIMFETNHRKATVMKGDAIVKVVAWESEKRIIDVDVDKPSILKLNTFYYPGWEAEIDGKKVDIAIEEPSGTMMVNILPGKHILALQFHNTRLRDYALYISIISSLIVIIILIL